METLDCKQTDQLTELSSSLLRTVLYFDVFQHPLTADELAHFSPKGRSKTALVQAFGFLVGNGMLFEFEGHFSVQEKVEELVQRRRKAEANADQAIERAHSRSKFIGKFPYVKGAYISGSMSKGVMYEDGDVDFFIITEPGRLWVARTLLVLYKKIVLGNSHKFFCVNYFIDSDHLEIEDQNLFSATEAVTLKPIYDSGVYQDFMSANSWVKNYFPNHPLNKVVYNGDTSRPVANVVESMFNNRLGDALDRFFMKNTLRFWKMKFSHFNKENFDLALKTRKYVSKHHPRNFQRKVMEALDDRIKQFEKQHNVVLS